eukprot:c28184_g1_i3 orf=399-689(-)
MKPISNLIQIMQNGSRMRNLLVSQFASSASFLSFSVVGGGLPSPALCCSLVKPPLAKQLAGRRKCKCSTCSTRQMQGGLEELISDRGVGRLYASCS